MYASFTNHRSERLEHVVGIKKIPTSTPSQDPCDKMFKLIIVGCKKEDCKPNSTTNEVENPEIIAYHKPKGIIVRLIGIVSRAFLPYLSERLPTNGIITNVPNPIICTAQLKIFY